ncbi:MAG: hypothetical protein LBQ29_15755 [Acinetobacter sp.]|jgi:predicted XRE-type DNA-binding protein|uniref:hypothetical protein n=1 Tax=Acinetobacter TaxID=469 RepID=UPI0004509DFA|nr:MULTISPECIES: hypothetical protein [Acinetobacter]EXB47365.1 hypothetical protein J522_2018 [Acinetobacter baumannii 146457]EYT24042.1 hypothetical protein J699_00080 [Acinetobacter sp. 1000160]MDR2062841.1 hypothetical protein [Acinetobacter sp.]
MGKAITPNMHIKQNLNAEIEAWLAKGNAITQIQTKFQPRRVEYSKKLKAMRLEDEQKQLKKQKRIDNQATQQQITMLSNWLNQHKGRAKSLVEVLGCAHSYISQIKSFTRPCSKSRFEEIKQAMHCVEQTEKYH